MSAQAEKRPTISLAAIDGRSLERPLNRLRLRPPRRANDLIGCARRIALLPAALGQEVTLVRAPAGFGKTVLCALWFEDAASHGFEAAWLTAESGEGYSAFHAHLAAALGLEPVQGGGIALANAIDERAAPAILFIDNGDTVTDPQSIALIDHLISYCPPNLRLVIACRGKPQFDVVSGEARGMVHHVGRDVLRLTPDERAQLPNPDLLAHTDGWPVICRLEQSGDPASVDRYFERSLWSGMTLKDQDLLKKCAVAETLEPGLVSALSGKSDGAVRLEQLGERGLPLLAADREARLTSFDPSFRSFLLRALSVEDPQTLIELHRRAQTYFVETGRPENAVDHSFEAGDVKGAAELISGIWRGMIRNGDCAKLLRWIGLLAPSELHSREDLELARCWALTLTGDDAAADAVGTARNRYKDKSEPAGELAMLEAWLSLSVHGTSTDGGFDYEGLATDDAFWARNIVRVWLAQIGVARGDFRPANVRAIWQHVAIAEDAYAAALAYVLEGQFYWSQGHLAEAERTLTSGYRRVLPLVDAMSLAPSLLAAPLARMLYERGATGAASSLIKRHWEIIETACPQLQSVEGFRVAIRCCVAGNDLDAAVNLIDRAERLGERRQWLAMRALAFVERVRLDLPQTIDPETIIAEADELHVLAIPRSIDSIAWSALAEARAYEAIRGEDRPRLNVVAARLLELGQALHDEHVITRATLFNVLPQLSGRCDRMVEIETVRLLNNAARIGFRRTITDVLELTGVHAEQNFSAEAYSSSSFISLLKQVDPTRRIISSPGSYDSAQGTGFSFLTVREIEIVQALRAGESNKEIARTLCLTPETVKWHLKNIMHKLRASSREEVVANAQTLGLSISSHD